HAVRWPRAKCRRRERQSNQRFTQMTDKGPVNDSVGVADPIHPFSAAPRVHLINPSDVSFGVAVITPRWLYVLASATGLRWGDPIVVDETLDPLDPTTVAPGDVVGIGIHTGNALRGYAIGRMARARGAWVVFGGVHATLF